MEALEFRIARDLFVVADHLAKRFVHAERRAETSQSDSQPTEAAEEVKYSDVYEFSVTFLELLGKHAVDLLEPAEGLPLDESGNPIRKEVSIHEDKVCSVHS